MRTRVKVCGITRLEDALHATEQGADALGFVFYAPSPRYVDLDQAAYIIRQVPAFVTTTALFVNAERTDIEKVISATSIDLLQFHGDETPDFCKSFERPYIKAIRVREGMDLCSIASSYSSAKGILLDAYVKGVPGGTGVSFDWAIIPSVMRSKVILAGGLHAANVADAVQQTKAYAVDVSGGVEVTKGIKDADKIRHFMNEVNRVNSK